MTATVTCIWVMVFTSSMLQTTVTSRYTNCRFNVTDLGCPVYGYTDWDCLKYEASCPKGTDYHCLPLHSEHSRYADGCDRSKECSKGEMPYWALIYDGIPTHVICDWCHDIEYFNPEKKSSSTYSHCPLKKVKCDYYNGIECLPGHKNDIYKQDRLCRCDARNNYVFGDLKRLKGQVCTSDQFLTTDCIRAEPCKDGQERLLNYTCVNKCKNGFRSNTSDECQPFLFTQPPFFPTVEPTETPGEPLPTAQSINTEETTTASTISSRNISSSPTATITSKDVPTLKSEVIQTTTKPIKPDSTSISANVLVICAILVLLIGIGIKLWQKWRSYQQRRKPDPQTTNDELDERTQPSLIQEWCQMLESYVQRKQSDHEKTNAGARTSAREEPATTIVEEPKPLATDVERKVESGAKESSPETGAGTSGNSAREETTAPTVEKPKPVKTKVEKEEESHKKESSPETGAETSGDSARKKTANHNVEELKPVKTVVNKDKESDRKESSPETGAERSGDSARKKTASHTVEELKPVKTVVNKDKESDKKESSPETELDEETKPSLGTVKTFIRQQTSDNYQIDDGQVQGSSCLYSGNTMTDGRNKKQFPKNNPEQHSDVAECVSNVLNKFSKEQGSHDPAMNLYFINCNVIINPPNTN